MYLEKSKDNGRVEENNKFDLLTSNGVVYFYDKSPLCDISGLDQIKCELKHSYYICETNTYRNSYDVCIKFMVNSFYTSFLKYLPNARMFHIMAETNYSDVPIIYFYDCWLSDYFVHDIYDSDDIVGLELHLLANGIEKGDSDG